MGYRRYDSRGYGDAHYQGITSELTKRNIYKIRRDNDTSRAVHRSQVEHELYKISPTLITRPFTIGLLVPSKTRRVIKMMLMKRRNSAGRQVHQLQTVTPGQGQKRTSQEMEYWFRRRPRLHLHGVLAPYCRKSSRYTVTRQCVCPREFSKVIPMQERLDAGRSLNELNDELEYPRRWCTTGQVSFQVIIPDSLTDSPCEDQDTQE